MTVENVAHQGRVIRFDRRTKCFERVFGSHIDMQLECRPAFETVFAGDDVQRISEFRFR